MRNGELHGGPACFVHKNGSTISNSYMDHGMQNGHGRCYLSEGASTNIKSTKKKICTNGWAHYIGQLYNRDADGQGKAYFTDGGVFNGLWKQNKMLKGQGTYLQENGTRTICQENYNFEKDSMKQTDWEKQVPENIEIESENARNLEYD